MSDSAATPPDRPTTAADGAVPPSTATIWVLTIGDELLAGDIVDTNAAFLSQCCREVGITVVRAVSVRDRIDEIVGLLTEASEQGVGACLVSGGLGPTTDDLTTAAIAAAAGVVVQRDDEAVARLREKFRAFGIDDMPPANLKQADFPVGAEILPNPIGSAEGFTVQMGACRVFSMPGVPRELKRMTREQVLPRLAEAWSLRAVSRRIYRVCGRGESSVAQKIEATVAEARRQSPGLANLFVHYRASMPLVSVIVEGVPGDDPAEPERYGAAATADELQTLDAPVLEALGSSVYGIGEAGLAARVIGALGEAGKTLATAESCTGGGIGALITAVSGASAVFLGGIISYSNEVKTRRLGVPEPMLQEHGAVSEPVARAMAQGAREAVGADLSIAVTGIAGPDGGTPDKPVGTVHIAVSDGSEVSHKELHLRGDRGTVQRSAALCALKLVWDHLASRGLATVRPMG